MCHHFIREFVEENEEALEHMATEKQLDNNLTKALRLLLMSARVRINSSQR